MRTACALAVTVTLIVSAGVAIADDRPPLSLSDDSRLQTKLDLKLVCEPLSVFADTLQKATGVKIRVRRDIADQNVTAFAKDITAAEAMASVSRVFGYKWECQDDIPEKRTYLLTRSQKQKIEAEQLRQAERQKKEQEFRDMIEDGIKMADADTSAWQKAFDRNPIQAAYDYSRRDAFREFGCFTKAERDNIWKRIAESPHGEVRIPFAQLPLSLQEFWRDKAASRHTDYPELFPSPDGLDESFLVVSRRNQSSRGWHLKGLPLGYTVGISMADFGQNAATVMNRDARMWGFMLEKLIAGGVDTSAYKPLKPDYTSSDSPSKRLEIKFHDDKTKERKHGGHAFAEIIRAAAEVFDADIFADDYLCRYRSHWSFRATFPDTLEEALEEIGREFRYEPTTSGKAARLRCSTWYMDEPSEVPKRLVIRWVEAKKKQGRLELKEFVDIARTLDNLQIKGLGSADLGGDAPLQNEVWRMASEVDNLRLCSMFNPTQLKRATGDGLPFLAMNPSQQQRFAGLLQSAKPDLPDDALAACSFCISEESKIKEEEDSDTGEPVKYQENYLYFTYIFAPGDQKRSEIYLDAKRLEQPPSQREVK